MTVQTMIPSFPVFTGSDGKPLTAGSVYFGQPSQDPRTSPKAVFYDAALTLPVVQPVSTQAGYLYRNGTPTRIYADGACSVLVLDSADAQVYYDASWDSAVSNVLAAVLDSPAFTGNPTAPTPAPGDNDTSVATTAFVKAAVDASLVSPTFTGDPKAPTAASGDNDTSIATTAFVQAATLGGVGQSWQNVFASRALTTVYTNSTGRAIAVSVSGTNTVATSTVTISLTVGGIVVCSQSFIAGAIGSFEVAASAVVPPGATYSVTGTQLALAKWAELR